MASKKVYEVAMILSATDKASRVIAESFAKSEARMKQFSTMGDKAFSFGRNAGAAGLVGAGILAGPLKAAADMEKMSISLNTAFQGNEAAATEAFAKITKFAEKTPYEMGEVLTSFIKLKNMGLDPSEEALTSYGNTASAMGKSLNEMIEAVADAATGEFERLKEFGIKANSEGNKVTFTFQGVKTTVGKNAKEIEQYLKYVGNVKFAGGIEKQSKSVYGQLSTLKDGVVQTAAKIGMVMIPKLKELFSKISPVIERISKWVSENPKLTSTIFSIVAAATALAFITSGLAFIFGGLFKVISAIIWIKKTYQALLLTMRVAQMAYAMSVLAGSSAGATFTAVVTAMNLAFLASPVFWIIAGIVALGVAIYSVYKNWGKIKEWFSKLWESVKQVIARFFAWINTTFLKYTPVMLIYNNWSKIVAFFSNLWDKVKAVFIAYFSFWIGLYKKFWDFGSNIVMGLWNGIKAKATALFNYVKEIGQKIANAFKNVLGINSPSKVFMQFGTNITEGVQQGVKKGAPAAVAATKNMGNAAKPSGRGSSTGSGGGMSITFSPVINGGGDSQSILAELKKYTPQLIREIEAALARRQRLAF